MNVGLTGKVALVTGGNRGPGREMVLAIAEHWPPGFAETVGGRLVLRRVGEQSEAVGAALYVASPASSFTTGTLRNDGDAR